VILGKYHGKQQDIWLAQAIWHSLISAVQHVAEPANLCTQARNQFGTPGGGEEFSKRGPNFLTMSSF